MDKHIVGALESFLGQEIEQLELFGDDGLAKELKVDLFYIKNPQKMIEEGFSQGLSVEHVERLALKALRNKLINNRYPDSLPIIQELDTEIAKYTQVIGC